MRAIATGLLGIGLVLTVGCGGGESTTAPPPPPPPDNTRSVAPHAGDGQRAKTGQPVPVAPAIRVTNRSGTPVAGVSVTFAIGTGNGVIAGASQSTGGDGVATVGGWTLGAVGNNTLVASVTGATAGSPVTFTATGEEILIQPGRDTTMSGVVTVTRFVVGAGVTITVADSLVIKADSTIELNGSLVGNCVPLMLDGKGDVTIKGVLDNGCTSAEADGAKLTVIGRGGYDVEDATLGSSGDVLITNDPTLTETDFEPGPAAAPDEAPAALNHQRCNFRRSQYPRVQKPARNGANTFRQGGAGRDGSLFTLQCRGNMLVDGNVVIRGQDAGNGGTGTMNPATGDADAIGGTGGTGGRVLISATGNIGFAGGVRIESGSGGRGGDGNATAGTGTGPVAPKATADGGKGGSPGLVAMRAKISVNFIDPTDLVIGQGGNGGDATAVAANGTIGAQPAQAGGKAVAAAGDGGATPDLPLHATNLTIVNPGNLSVQGGDGGDGGTAEAISGNGSRGSGNFRDGADGGEVVAFGGFGGDALLRNHRNNRFGGGGDGGPAIFRGAMGGQGISNCAVPLFGRGGNAGNGGDVSGGDGHPGTGAGTGANGWVHYTARLANAGYTSGNGLLPNGNPAPGTAGRAGQDLVTVNGGIQRDAPRGFTQGLTGTGCITISVLAYDADISLKGPLGSSCEIGIVPENISNFSTGAATFNVVWNGPANTLRFVPTSGMVGAAPLSTSDPFSRTSLPIIIMYDPCRGGSAIGVLKLQMAVGVMTFDFLIAVSIRLHVT